MNVHLSISFGGEKRRFAGYFPFIPVVGQLLHVTPPAGEGSPFAGQVTTVGAVHVDYTVDREDPHLSCHVTMI